MNDSEHKLWRAVLEQAYEDAEGEAAFARQVDGMPVEHGKASRFLCADNVFEQENLALVCEFADVPADRVISWARGRYAIAA